MMVADINPTMPVMFKYVVLMIGVLFAVGNLFPELPIWGFNYWVINLPFRTNDEWVGLLGLLYVSSFPFMYGKSLLYDRLYIVISVVLVAFFLVKGYGVARSVFEGVDACEQYQLLTEDMYCSSSVFFSYPARTIAYALMIIYLIWSLRLCRMSWRSIAIVSASVFITSSVTISSLSYSIR